MKRPLILKIINILLIIDFTVLASTGVFNEYIPGNLYEIVHVFPGYMLILLVSIHLSLNWGWIQHTYFKKK